MEKSLFEQICSLENLYTAWEKFSAGKHSKSDVMTFEYRLEDHLFSLQADLIQGRYQHDPYEPFSICDPKQRRIHKATVKDRIVHQAVANVVEPLFEHRFIHDSYSCRVGKGTHAAVNRLRALLRQASRNNTRTVYALKCDVKKFFASIHHGILYSLLRKRIFDVKTFQLLENIIESFSVAEHWGIPLGNLTSQLFANIYLHELDWFVKMDLCEKYYVRYCDDFIILSESRERLIFVTEKVDHYLNKTLLLTLHPKKVFIRTWAQGIDFLGYVSFPHATVLRTKTSKRMLQRVNTKNVASYMGVCSHADAFELGRIILTKSFI
jgi:retron-type reverse transcriptase